MRAARPRRAAMAGLMATAAPEAPSVASSSAVMQRQCAAIKARRQQAAARDVLGRRHTAVLANGRDLAPELAEMDRGERVELVLELAARERANSGEQRSGAHAATPALTRPSPRRASARGTLGCARGRPRPAPRPARIDPAGRRTLALGPTRARRGRAEGRYPPTPARSARAGRPPPRPAWYRCGSPRARRARP